MIPTERVAVVTYLLTKGHKFTTTEVSAIAGIQRHSAYRMLTKMSVRIPLFGPYRDEQTRKIVGTHWQIVDDEDASVP